MKPKNWKVYGRTIKIETADFELLQKLKKDTGISIKRLVENGLKLYMEKMEKLKNQSA